MTAPAQKIAFNKGYVDLFERGPLGQFINGLWAGNVPKLDISCAVEKEELRESYTGQNALIATVFKSKTLTGSFDTNDLGLYQLVRNLQGQRVPVVGATVTDEAVADTVGAGRPFFLQSINITTATIRAGSVTLVADTDYILNLKTGRGVMLTDQVDVKATYTHAGHTALGIFAAADQNYGLRYAGINSVDGKPYVLTLYNLRIAPAQNLSFIGDTFSSCTIAFDVLIDDQRSGSLGQFGDLRTVD